MANAMTFEQIRDGIANAIEDWPHDEYWPPTIAEMVRAIGPTPSTPSAESAPPPPSATCKIDILSSRMCEFGIKGCVTKHPPATPPSESDRGLAIQLMNFAFRVGKHLYVEEAHEIIELCRQHFQPATIPLVDRVAERLTREATGGKHG